MFNKNIEFENEKRYQGCSFSKLIPGFIFNSKRPGKPEHWPIKTRNDIKLSDHHIISKY